MKICQQCGAALSPDAPAGLCPVCLLGGAATGAAGGPAESGGLRRGSMPVPGRDFGGYHVNRQLGEGGMGKVFEAVQLATGRRVALKVMGQALTQEKDRRRFLREGRVAASVNHPNVVYVYGSEEIEGVPVIVMELVHGGTLNERLKAGGPLPVTAAVGAALEIITGLEAAHAAGVLHRDIKPANCFITTDSQVKVGDFGLSLSTEAHLETRLTAQGSAMGTPAYASPEQLQGEELDVRADIYSTGATLYHLLTGRPPFTANDFVKQIAEVLGKEPEAPHRVRPEVPVELSRIVLRCLAKERKSRFQSYEELRDALLPFTAGEPVPAPLPRRLLAGLVDHLVTMVPMVVLQFAAMFYMPGWFQNVEHGFTVSSMSIMPEKVYYTLDTAIWVVWHLLYYTVCEGRWGAGVGKILCGLRVMGPDGRPPGLLRALGRTAGFTICKCLALVFLLLKLPANSLVSVLASGVVLLGFPLLFVTMRKRNGYLALHDWLSGTRVVVRPRQQVRPVYEAGHKAAGSGANRPAFDQPVNWGPYVINARLWVRGDEELLLGADPVLHRPLWVHVRGAEAPPVAELRQDLGRPARLRWVNGGVSNGMLGGVSDGGGGERCWDAYEAVEGGPLLNCLTPVPWGAVRFWLLDLAEEMLGARRRPLTAPVFSFDRIWITRSGRAMLLDFPCPQLAERIPPPEELAADTTAEAQAFLDAVARRALEGAGTASRPGQLLARVPLPAGVFLASLAKGSFERMDAVAGNLRHLTSLPAELSRSWRVASLALVPVVSISLALMLLLGMYWFVKHHREFETAWQTAQAHSVHANETGHGPGVLPRYDAPSTGAAGAGADGFHFPQGAYLYGPVFTLMAMMIMAGMTDFFAAVFFGFSPVLKLFGIAVVNRQGRRAARWRLGVRSLAGLVPPIILTVIFIRIASEDVFVRWHWVLLAGWLALLLAIVFVAVRWPDRSLADQVAGTWLVPE